MSKKELKNKTMVVRLSESEQKEIQDFITFSGVDQSTFLRNSIRSYIDDFEQRYKGQGFSSWRDNSNQREKSKEEISDMVSEIDAEAKEIFDEIFSKKANTIPDQHLIDFGGLDVKLTLLDMIRLEVFAYEELGLPSNHHINWESPLVGLLIRFLRFSSQNFKIGTK